VTSDVLHLIASREVVHPTAASFLTYYRHPAVTHVPLRDTPPLESTLVWATDRETATVRAFAGVTNEVVERHRVVVA
jgi:hypothetical protein